MMWCLRRESSVPASYVAAIEGGSIDSGSDDEVLEIALLACTVLLSRRQKEEIKKKDVGAQYSLPASIERRIPP